MIASEANPLRAYIRTIGYVVLTVLASITNIYASEGEFATVHIELAHDLALDGNLSRQRQVPILLMISGIDCTFCARLKEEYLEPMLRNAEYEKKIIMREVVIDDGSEITNYDGMRISSHDLSLRYKASLTPTLLFINHQGKELAERVVGYTTPSMYGYYLDRSIDQALDSLLAEVINTES